MEITLISPWLHYLMLFYLRIVAGVDYLATQEKNIEDGMENVVVCEKENLGGNDGERHPQAQETQKS